MATTRASQPVKLGEFLREQQEPFILEVYLSERGHAKKYYNSEANSGCRNSNSSNSGKRIPQGSKVLRAVYNKLTSRNKNSHNKDGKHRNIKEQEVAEQDRFSSTGSITAYNSCPESDIEEPSMPVNNSQFLKLHDQRENEADTDGKFQWKEMKDSEQRSPLSVLEKRRCSREREDYTFSDSTSDLLQSRAEKPSFGATREFHEFVWINPPSPSHYLISLRQTKQLLFHCVRELVESKEGKERRWSDSKDITDIEKPRQVTCEKKKRWGEQSGELLNSDCVASPEWGDFESGNRDIGLEIGDAILEDITQEIVVDMNDIKVRMYNQFS